MEKNRNNGIDVLKFVAAILITNSHMDLLYVNFGVLATGGTIGDVLFFFCSGFTLYLKPIKRGFLNFSNWYKKRINRIYPSVLAVAIIRCIFFDNQNDIVDILVHGGGWFVSCIMIYYLLIYLIGCYGSIGEHRNFYFYVTVVAVLSVIWFFCINRPEDFNMYRSENTLKNIEDISEGGYLKWLVFFIYMILGAKMGMISISIKSNIRKDLLLLIISIVGFYGFYIIPRKMYAIEGFQIFSFVPLIFVVYYFYKISTSGFFEKIYENVIVRYVVRFVGGLCLEIYLIQFSLFTDMMNGIFPLNILIMFLIIVVAAYLVRCLSRIILQTFRTEPYDWKNIFNWI